MFRGRHEHTIDGKGRLSIPSRFREILVNNYSDMLIVTNSDRCLFAYPKEEWEALERHVASLSQMKPEMRTFQRLFISGAVECPLDRQGRILIPPSLREYADLQKNVVIVGMLKRLEVWSRDRWNEIFTQAKNNFEKNEELSNVLAELGL